MRKDIKKNNKMVLALVVVAALAMVSVAGIALHSGGSDAAGDNTYTNMVTNNTVTIEGSPNTDYKLYVPDGFTGQDVCTVVITGNYTGTISIGTSTTVLPTADSYTPFASIDLAGASNVQITAVIYSTSTGPVAIFMLGDGIDPTLTTDGTYTLTQGQAIFGAATIDTDWTMYDLSTITDVWGIWDFVTDSDFVQVPFTGTVTAGGLSVTADNTIGVIMSVTDDGLGLLSGFAAPFDWGNDATLSISGTGSIQYPAAMQAAMDDAAYVPDVTFYTEQVDVTIEEGAQITVGDTATDAITTYMVGWDSSLTVLGNIDFLYTSVDKQGVLDLESCGGTLTIPDSGSGIVSQGMAPPAGVITPPATEYDPYVDLPLIFGTPNLNTAFYFVNAGPVAAPTSSTYYFTTIKTALDNNANPIYLTGDIVITQDTNLFNDTGDLVVILLADSTLTVGDGTLTPTLNVTNGTTLTITDPINVAPPVGTGPGPYVVVSGKAVYDTEPTGNDVPQAPILLEQNGQFIYTDVVTGLGMAKSGDTLVLQMPASLTGTTDVVTIPTGVTLKDSDTNGVDCILTIPADKTLIVNGTLDANIGMVIDGALRIQNGTVNFDGADVALTGSIDVVSGTLNVINDSFVDGANIGYIQSKGTINVSGESGIEVSILVLMDGSTFNIEKASAAPAVAASTVTIIDQLLVVGNWYVPSLPEINANGGPATSTLADNTVNVTVNGTMSLGFDLGDSALATVYGTATVPLASSNPLDEILSTQLIINNVVYCTLSSNASTNAGIAASMLVTMPNLYLSQLKDVTVSNWNTDPYLRGYNLIDEGTGAVSPNQIGFVDPTPLGDVSWAKLYAKNEPKMYTVTLQYTPGVTWSVNGVPIDSSNTLYQVAYGDSVTVKAFAQVGYDGTPVILVNGGSYNGSAYKVTDNVTFSIKDGSVQVSTGGNGDNNNGLSLIEILLIIIVIIIAIIAIIIAIRLLRS